MAWCATSSPSPSIGSSPCRQSSVSLTGIDRDAFSSPIRRPSGQYLSDLRYVDGSARFGEQQGSNRLNGDSRGQHQDLDACDGHNSSSSGNGGGPFFSFTRSPHRLFVRALSDAQETAFEQLVSEGEKELPNRLHQTIRKLQS